MFIADKSKILNIKISRKKKETIRKPDWSLVSIEEIKKYCGTL